MNRNPPFLGRWFTQSLHFVYVRRANFGFSEFCHLVLIPKVITGFNAALITMLRMKSIHRE